MSDPDADGPQQQRCPFFETSGDGAAPVCLSRPGDPIIVGARYVQEYCLSVSHRSCSLFQHAEVRRERSSEDRNSVEAGHAPAVARDDAPAVETMRAAQSGVAAPAESGTKGGEESIVWEPTPVPRKRTSMAPRNGIPASPRRDGVIDVEPRTLQRGPIEVVATPIRHVQPLEVDETTISRPAPSQAAVSRAVEIEKMPAASADVASLDEAHSDGPQEERGSLSRSDVVQPPNVLRNRPHLRSTEKSTVHRTTEIPGGAATSSDERDVAEWQGTPRPANGNLYIVPPLPLSETVDEPAPPESPSGRSRLVLVLAAAAVLLLIVGVLALLVHRGSIRLAAGAPAAASNVHRRVPSQRALPLSFARAVVPRRVAGAAPVHAVTLGPPRPPPMSPARSWTFLPIQTPADQVILILSNPNRTSVNIRIRISGKGHIEHRGVTISPGSEAELQMESHPEADTVRVRSSGPLLAQRFVIRKTIARAAPGSSDAGPRTGTP